MASTGKKKTTMAKRDRENRLRARRLEKQAKKDARRQASAHDRGEPSVTPTEAPARDAGESAPDVGASALAADAHQTADAS